MVYHDVRFEVFTAVKIHVKVFWVVTPYPTATLYGITTQKAST
jgi:hypothetical protein